MDTERDTRNIPYSMQHYLQSHDTLQENLRSGPNPLPVHIGMATISERADQSADDADQMLRMMIQGIKRYQSHPYQRDMEPFPEVWRAGEVSIGLCKANENGATKPAKASILLVPSMINKSYILDLLPERSLARWLSQQGLDVYFLDWGDPLKDDQLNGMDMLISERLVKALEFVTDHTEVPCFALGYCMGGTLLLGAVQEMSDKFAGVIFLAAPWNFHDGEQPLTNHISQGLDLAGKMIAEHNYLPADWIQSIFAAVNADRSASKFKNFDLMEQDSDKAIRFVAVEDWLNDPVHLPARLGKECLSLWYEKNLTVKDQWCINGTAVRPQNLKARSLVIYSPRDRLVPAQSSEYLFAALPDADKLVPDTGHIGMIAGGQAPDIVWQPALDWINSVL